MNSQTNNSKANILVVDDTPDNLRLLSAMLTERGYTVRKALSGQMALTACQAVLPDLILLDINMPEMNGYEVCQKLKISEKTIEIPVIFISALDDVLDKVKAFDVGGVDYITKPFQGAEVISRIENQVKLRSLQIKLQEQNILLQQEIQERQKAQTQLILNEKMVALGQLVAGIAHEINNPVSFIYGNLTYADRYLQDLVALIKLYQQEYPNPTIILQDKVSEIDLAFLIEDVHKLMEAMHRGVDRIQEIVLSLRNFSRLDQAEMKPVDIHEGIDSTVLILQHRLRETVSDAEIKLIKNYKKLPLVTCYPSQLNQVFMYLLNNAIDAIDEAHGGEKQFPAPEIRIETELTTANTVIIRIADNGTGIDESVRSRLFDPFFTTKPVGKGTGLGLSISYQIIVQKHGGKIICSPTEVGAEFTIEIPVCQNNCRL